MRFLPRHNKKLSFNTGSETGVTLLLAIIVLSSIMAISFSLATVLFVEIRTSADLLKSESAINAAETVGEEALFQVKRSVAGFSYSTRVGGTTLSAPVTTSIQDSILHDQVLKTSYAFNVTSNVYVLYNPDSSSGGSGYGKIQVNYLDAGTSDTLSVYMCEFDPGFVIDPSGENPRSYPTAPCSDPGPSTYWLARAWPLNSGSKTISWTLDPSKQQQLILFNGTLGGPIGTIYVTIQTFGPESPAGSGVYPPKGIPYFGSKAVDITASDANIVRKVRVIVPIGGSK